MKRFDILDRNQNIHRHTLLEASAGTGKTFTIENLVVRLLIEDPACTIEEILVVTFTRATKNELKERIHRNIEQALCLIKNKDRDKSPDFLKKILEDETQISIVKRRLEHALMDFDLASITTIHAFCEHSLKDFSFIFDEETEAMNDVVKSHEIRKVIHDFFLTGLKNDLYSPVQLQYVLSSKKQDIRNVENALIKLLSKGIPIAPTENFQALFEQFQEIIISLRERLNAQNIKDDLKRSASLFKKIIDSKTKEIKSEIQESINLLDNLLSEKITLNTFEKTVSDGLEVLKLFSKDNLKCKAVLPDSLHFIEDLQNELMPVINKARNPNLILGRMAHDCSIMWRDYLNREEKYQHDDLLKKMLKRSSGSHFAQHMRALYKAVIIDEFQDTDPIQWGIFDELFLKDPEKRSILYLVGDPKQSIYAFRQADIYTYMSAVEALGEDHVASLDTNYRSEPDLIKALNALFSEERIPDFFHLPKQKKNLSCPPVYPGKKPHQKDFQDNHGAIHFYVGKEEKKGRQNPLKLLQENIFFPEIVQEMIRLKNDCSIPFSSWAILVRDRYQAENFSNYCERFGVPTRKQKPKSLLSSPAFPLAQDLLTALNHPKDLNALKIVFGGPLMNWGPDKLKLFEEESRLLEICNQWSWLCEKALSKGFAEFIDYFLRSQWLGEDHVYSTLLVDSKELYYELIQICDLISDFQNRKNASISQCEQYLHNLKIKESEDSEELFCLQNCDDEAVEILTIHMSKGLEFDIVVPLGLINRISNTESFIPVQNDSGGYLTAVTDSKCDLYLNYQKEIDAEKMRQLYVALTRAKHRLYIPIVFPENHSIQDGVSSSFELFVSYFQEDFFQWLENEGKQFNITVSHPMPACPKRYIKPPEEIPLDPPSTVNISAPRQMIYSFSSIAKSHNVPTINPPNDFLAVEKNPFTIPSGRDIGLLLHEILETISYVAVKNAGNIQDTGDLVRPYTMDTPFHEWNEAIAEIIFKTLKNPFLNGMSLCDIPCESRYHEIEFIYPENGTDDFLKGVIDLAFECSGYFYIVDWKSNWLGSAVQDYDDVHMESAMKDHEYFLQADIYRQAFERYLKPFGGCFGGAYYLFLRGIQLEGTSGIYQVLPCKV